MMFGIFMSISGQRTVESLNFDWKYQKGWWEGASQPEFNDSQWQTVNLPHDASIAGPFVKDSLGSDRQNGFLPRQKGWYRKEVDIDFSLEGKKIFFDFEGVYRDAHVYVNGREMAHQLNGYQAFRVDVTSVIHSGKNSLAVSYDNTYQNSSRWYNGEGIYRDVWMVVTNDVYVDQYGTYARALSLSDQKARVALDVEVINEMKATEVTLKTEILTPDGQLIKTLKSVVPLGEKEQYTFKQEFNIENPQIWDIDSPLLYTANSYLIINDTLVDLYQTSFGLRCVEFDAEKGLMLNGRKILVKGVNIHHDLGPLGAAAFRRGYERRLEGLKKLGCNAIRLSHNPHDTAILDWCDKNGMLVLDEAFDKWADQFFGEGNDFNDYWRSSLESFVRRDRNHPSVFLWSVGNETTQQRSPRYGFGVPMLKEMVAFVHQLEPTRKVTCGLHPSRKSGAYRTENYYREGPPEMEFYMDIVSTNYREEFWAVDKAAYPQLMFLLSEAQVGNLGNEWFNFNHDTSVGMFYWGGTDYIGESFGWPAKGWVNGIIDWDDHWKPFSYYIQSLYSEKPMVHIAVFEPNSETKKYWNEVQLRFQPMYSHWNWAGKDSVRLYTFSNCQEVELFINGKSQGIKKIPDVYYTKKITSYSADEYDPDAPINVGPAMHKQLEWIVPYQPGKIVAVSRINGKEVARHEMVTAGAPHAIVLEPDRTVIKADGLDLSYITVKIVDKNGVLIPDAVNNIKFNVSGAGVIAGVGNADLLSDESFVSDQRKVFQGKALLIIRAGREKGVIKINAKTEGLKSSKCTIEVN
jgi:beta-galactosidase